VVEAGQFLVLGRVGSLVSSPCDRWFQISNSIQRILERWIEACSAGGLLCYVHGHFDWLLVNYICWYGQISRGGARLTKLDRIAHRRIGALTGICVWIFSFPPRLSSLGLR
jgi:hypothetical protein